MAIELIVTEPFGSYKHGDQITDPETIAQVSRDFPRHFVRRQAEDPVVEVAPEVEKAAEPAVEKAAEPAEHQEV